MDERSPRSAHYLDTSALAKLVAALRLGDGLDSLVTCDQRLADAATSNGIPVTAPA